MTDNYLQKNKTNKTLGNKKTQTTINPNKSI